MNCLKKTCAGSDLVSALQERTFRHRQLKIGGLPPPLQLNEVPCQFLYILLSLVAQTISNNRFTHTLASCEPQILATRTRDQSLDPINTQFHSISGRNGEAEFRHSRGFRNCKQFEHFLR